MLALGVATRPGVQDTREKGKRAEGTQWQQVLGERWNITAVPRWSQVLGPHQSLDVGGPCDGGDTPQRPDLGDAARSHQPPGSDSSCSGLGRGQMVHTAPAVAHPWPAQLRVVCSGNGSSRILSELFFWGKTCKKKTNG